MKKLLKILFFVQAGVNLIGALGPELAFDALWYHLPIARLEVERGWWGPIPGGLLYYSGLPRLMEWVNGGLLWLGGQAGMSSPEILPKLLSWIAGIGCAWMIYKLSKSWAVVVLWYSTLLVGWQSITVYTDLARTWLVLVGFYFWQNKTWAKFGLAMGLAYSVKIITGAEYLVLAAAGWRREKDWKGVAKSLAVFLPFVWFWGGWQVIGKFSILDTRIGPLLGDGRYILPEAALLVIWLWHELKNSKIAKGIMVGAAVFQGLLGIGYRAAANAKFVPVVIGHEAKSQFLTEHLNFTYGDWYDTDGWVQSKLAGERYLVEGVHNTYYLPGKRWDHESWADPNYCYRYVLIQGGEEPAGKLTLLHETQKSQTKVYRNEDCK